MLAIKDSASENKAPENPAKLLIRSRHLAIPILKVCPPPIERPAKATLSRSSSILKLPLRYGSKSFTPCNFNEITYFNIDLKDDGNMNISNAIIKFINFVKEVSKNENNKILIHCAEGVSRSPALVVAYLMWKYNMDCLNAVNFVKSKRNCIDINLGFMFQLENLNTHREIFKQIF